MENNNGKYILGLSLMAIAIYLFLDSVRITGGGMGWCSRILGGYETTSAAIVFMPFFTGIVALFYNSQWKWAKWLTEIGFGIIVLEIISRIHFWFFMKTTHFIFLIILFAAGMSLILQLYRKQK